MRMALAVIAVYCACALGGPAANMPPGGAPSIDSAHTFVLHLPGIAGDRWVDKQMTSGLRDAGYSGELLTYDWTENKPGISALQAFERNQTEAAKIADIITAHYRADPSPRIILTGHSGGTGLAVWALEKLPADVKVDTVMLLSSALSPGYDLTKALEHVRGTCYSFYSENDVLVLNTGTKLFGTIDGKKCESAGEFGFVFPDTADAKQYAKLIQKPYDKSWMKYDNIGDHMGSMRRPFSANILAPLLFNSAPRLTANAATDAKAEQRR